MNVAEILQQHASRYPEQVALADVRRGHIRRTTYGELDRSAGRLAKLLKQSGLSAGDTVLVFHRMSTELYVALAAIFRLGLVAMFVDPSAGSAYIERCCRLRPPQALIAGSKAHLLRLLMPALRRIPLKFSIGCPVPGAIPTERASRLECDNAVQSTSPDAAALVSFTSGNTGEPKAAVRTHGFLLAQHRAIERSLSLVPGEVELVTLPIFVLANLASRVTSLIPNVDLRRPDEIDPEPIVSLIGQLGATRAAASPIVFDSIVEYCEVSDVTLPCVRKAFTGGGPVSPRLLERLRDIMPYAEITVVYGSTEAEPISTVSFSEMDAEDLSATSRGLGLLAGQPVDCLKLRILEDNWGRSIGPFSGDEFKRLFQPIGEPGEIVVQGEHVLSGYLNGQSNDVENKIRVDDAVWHRTGDAGYLDQRGRLWLLGRCAARVDDGRGALYPFSVEHAALRHDAIRRAAMVSLHGERVLAVELRRRREVPDLASLLKALTFASVDSVRIVKRLPVDGRHNAKVDYFALHALLE
ncbi:MAG: AMP-binding protein [Planctomycetaceae bacterium]